MPHNIDYTYIKQAMGGDTTALKNITSLFLGETATILENINKSVTENNWQTLKSNVHKIKSSLRMFGLNDMAELCMKTELIISKGEDLSNIREIVDQISKELPIIMETIRADIEKL